MPRPEIHFTHPCFADKIKPKLGNFTDKLKTIANDADRQRFDDRYVPDPTDIEVTPAPGYDQMAVVLRMWQQTSGDKPAIFQGHDTSFQMSLDGEEAFVVTEANIAYPLTTREALLLDDMSKHAIAHTIAGTLPDGL